MKEKILIIEDDFTIQTQLKTLLSGNGYEVFAVTDFSKTIEQLKEAAPHLVILDIKLPGNNGFEICSGIRTFSDIPIVFVTSSNTDMDELNSIMLGGDAFITKPYNPAILLAKIAALLKKAYRSPQTEIEISCIPRDLIIVIFYYQISLKPLKTLSLAQVSFPLLFPLCYIVPPVFTNSDKGKYKGKKTDNTL